jgi:hypothetical protein
MLQYKHYDDIVLRKSIRGIKLSSHSKVINHIIVHGVRNANCSMTSHAVIQQQRKNLMYAAGYLNTDGDQLFRLISSEVQ